MHASTARPAGRAPAAITFLQANLTENVAAAGEAEPGRGVAGLGQTGVAEGGHGHGAAGQEGPAGARGWGRAARPPAEPRGCGPATARPLRGPEGSATRLSRRGASRRQSSVLTQTPQNLFFLASHY